MIFRGRDRKDSYAVSLTERSLTVSREEREVAAYDRAGRLYSFYRDPDTYRRGLNGRVLHRRQDPAGRSRAWLSDEEADCVVDAAADLAAAARAALDGPGRRPGAAVGPGQALEAALRLAVAFRHEAARADAEHFRRVYSPIGILPPDQYLALLVQATEGCSFSTCTFCDLYHLPYRVRTVTEFREHLAAVLHFMGASLTLRGRSVFLGAANALAVPTGRLSAFLRVLCDVLGHGGPRPVHAFVDAFTGVHKRAGDYRALHELGLARVYVGLESGHDPLLSFVRKPGTASQALDTVRALKAGGVRVGVIVMIGLGGDRFAEGHARDTAEVINAMALGAGDLIYLSDLVEIPGTSYPALARDAGIRPLDAARRRAERDRLRASLAFHGRPPKIASYDITEFVY